MQKFRPYQLEASSAILKAWANKQNCITVVATGGGKTIIAAGTSARIQQNGGGRILFLANRNELCQQPLAAFNEQLGFAPALEKADNYAPLDAKVVVASVQTLSRKKRLERFPSDHFSYIWADECHMSVAQSWKRIFEHFSSAHRCGITATPFRTDGKSLTGLFETEAYRKDLFSLVDDGYLVNPDHVDKLSTAISLAQVRVKHTVEGLDYDVQDAADAIEPYFREIARELKQKHAQRHILAFLPLVASSQKFVAACVAEGLNAVHVDGEDPQREQKLAAFRAGNITLLSNASLLHTGVDIPVCDATLNLRPTKSKVLYQQIVGRSTRCQPGIVDTIPDPVGRLQAIERSSKPKAYIIDPLWLTKDFDLVTPSYLIASSEAEANEMNKAAGKSYSLRALHSKIQLEREAAIQRRLASVANFREGKVASQYFAACTHDRLLLDYAPVYPWERAKPTRFTCRLLERDGIDPETVSGQGEADAILKAIGRRKNRRLPEIRSLAAAAEQGVDSEILWSMTMAEARKYGL